VGIRSGGIMSRIVISDDKSLENLDIRFDHLLLNSEELQAERDKFKPIESILDEVPEDFFPTALVSVSGEKALSLLQGDDELELFFMIMLARNQGAELFDKLRSLKEKLESHKYRDLLIFLFFHCDHNKDRIINEIRSVAPHSKDGVADFIISAYSDEANEIKVVKGAEYICASLFEAVKAEKSGDISKAFTLMLELFEKSGYSQFIFEVLKFYLVQYNGISSEQIELFTNKVSESPLTISFSHLKFIEFLYYYRNGVNDKIESSVSALAESTDSVFILNVIAPILYKFQKWHLIGKFYKLSAKKTSGAERTKYLELLADVYENKLDMPDFATEIHKNIVEDDPLSCSISLSRVLSVYEENGMWDDLFNLYNQLSGREADSNLQAYYLYKAGDVLHRELNKSVEARALLEKSLALKHSFEVVRTLSEIYLKMHDYDAYIRTLLKELEFSLEESERIRVLTIIAETYMNNKKDYISAQKYYLNILEISPGHLPTIKKLGKIYYLTKSWKKLTEINFKEIDLIKDLVDTVNLYYRNGSIFFKELGDMERAMECFMEILEIEPDHIPTLLYLEKIYMRKKDIGNLIVLYKRLLEASHTDSETRQYYLTRLGIIYRDSNMSKESADIFKAIIKMFPDNIMARENLRMIEGLADFSGSGNGSFVERDIEHFTDLIKTGDPSNISEQYLKRCDNSLWKDLYFFKKKGEIPDSSSYRLSPDEQFVINLLERKFSIDNLIKNSSKKTALMLLVEKYLDEKYYKGIQTILKYYLKFEPDNKRKVWAMFFRGLDNPEMKEEFENILMSGSDIECFNIVREILEKIYIKDGDFQTILFLRNAYTRKLSDPVEKCRFIDASIEMLSEQLDSEQLFDLYKLRYKSTPQEQLESYTAVYESFLKNSGKDSLLVPICEARWEKSKTVENGTKYAQLLINQGNELKALDVLREISKMTDDNSVFELYSGILAGSLDYDASIAEINRRLAEEQNGTFISKLKELLLDIYLAAGYTTNAMELFRNSHYEDMDILFSKGLDLATLMKNAGFIDDSVVMVRSLIALNSEQAERKLTFLIDLKIDLTDDDFNGFTSYRQVKSFFVENMSENCRKIAVKYFFEKGDEEAAAIHITNLIKDGFVEEAGQLINSHIKGDIAKTVMMSKLAWKNGNFDEEKKLLKDIVMNSIIEKETYPLKRLIVLEKDNRRTICFLSSIMKESGDENYNCEDSFSRLFSLEMDDVFNLAGFNEIDYLFKEYARIMISGVRDENKISGKPLNGSSHRPLILLLEQIKLATGFEDIHAVFDENLATMFEISPGKIPCIIFGPDSLNTDIRRLKYDILRNVFMAICGVGEGIYESMSSTLKLTGKDKVKFIKGMRENLQSRFLEIFNRLESENSEKIRSFVSKLDEASFYYAFAIVPDIRFALMQLNITIEGLNSLDPEVVKFAGFLKKYFFKTE